MQNEKKSVFKPILNLDLAAKLEQLWVGDVTGDLQDYQKYLPNLILLQLQVHLYVTVQSWSPKHQAPSWNHKDF